MSHLGSHQCRNKYLYMSFNGTGLEEDIQCDLYSPWIVLPEEGGVWLREGAGGGGGRDSHRETLTTDTVGQTQENTPSKKGKKMLMSLVTFQSPSWCYWVWTLQTAESDAKSGCTVALTFALFSSHTVAKTHNRLAHKITHGGIFHFHIFLSAASFTTILESHHRHLICASSSNTHPPQKMPCSYSYM